MLTSMLVLSLLGVDGGTPVKPAKCSATQELCFSPKGACDKPLIALIDKATSTLDVAVYSLNRTNLVDAILRAKARGVAVRVVLDSSQLHQDKELTQVKRLADAGIPLKRNGHSGIMHIKIVLIDHTWFENGSFNYTDGATDKNDENMLIWSCPKLVSLYENKFNQMWGSFLPVVTDQSVP